MTRQGNIIRVLYSLLILALSAFRPTPATAAEVGAVPGEVLIGLAPGSDGRALQQALAAGLGTVLDLHGPIGVCRVRLRDGLNPDAAAHLLQHVPGVQFVERNILEQALAAPNDPYYGYQHGLSSIRAEAAWSNWRPVAPVIVAIVDSGIDSTHPDLANKILRDAGGIVGYDAFLPGRGDALDAGYHGTHCAGIVAAQVNNGVGIAGVAGWDGNPATSDFSYVKLMPVRVLDGRGTGTTAALAEGIVWAADHGAQIISLSLGGTTWSATRSSAVRYALQKGCLVVAAAGNSGNAQPIYPAAEPGVLSVAATDYEDRLLYFSQFGTWVRIAAPGDQIYSTTPTYPFPAKKTQNYAYASGTSMACPHVSGAAALLLAQYPGLTASQVADLLVRNTDPYVSSDNRMLAPNAGRLNIDRALQAAAGVSRTRPPSLPGSPPPSPQEPPAPTQTASLSSLSISPAGVIGGSTATLKITLDRPAPAEGFGVALASDGAAASLPETVTVPAGMRSASVTVSTRPVKASTTVTLSASARGVTRDATLSVETLALASLTLTSRLLATGRPVDGVVTLVGAAPAGGVEVQLTSSRPDLATVPPTVIVPEGETRAMFSLTKQPSQAAGTATTVISARAGGVTRVATVYVRNP